MRGRKEGENDCKDDKKKAGGGRRDSDRAIYKRHSGKDRGGHI